MNFLSHNQYLLFAALVKLLLVYYTFRNFPRKTLLVNTQGFHFTLPLLLNHTEVALVLTQPAEIIQILYGLQ